MLWRDSSYDVDIRRQVDPKRLARLSAAAIAAAEVEGYLAGNAMYQDLVGLGWSDLVEALDAERSLIKRLCQAADLEAEAEAVDEERLEGAGADALWNLDIGVASATIAISALGAIPVGSCNAGGFGGRHQASYPYVAFYLPPKLVDVILELAEQVGVGLIVDDNGLAQIYGSSNSMLLHFAERALRR